MKWTKQDRFEHMLAIDRSRIWKRKPIGEAWAKRKRKSFVRSRPSHGVGGEEKMGPVVYRYTALEMD